MITFKDLEQFGLSEKKAKVYLASLEMGPATAAQIAQKAKINRATTYVEIESLMKIGMMSTFEQNKTTLFSAESPASLKRLVAQKEEQLKAQLSSLDKLLPGLVQMYEYAGEKPKVRFFEGKEGLLTMQEDFLKTKDKKVEAIYNVDDLNVIFSEEEQKHYYQERSKRKILVRALYNRKKGPFEGIIKFTDDHYVPYEIFLFSSDITIYENKVAIASLKEKLVGVIIENKQMADTFRSLFNLAWEAAQKYQKKK